jgi:2-haloacid dehalogenase
MSPFGSVRAVALDLDNTVIDFSASREAGLDAVLARIAKQGYTVDRAKFLARHQALVKAEDGLYLTKGTWMQVGERFATLAREYGLPSDGFVAALAELYTETRLGHLKMFPESVAALEALKAKYPLYLVTNGPPASQHREIEATGVSPYFRRMFVCEDYAMRKPNPAMFEKIRAEAGVANEAMMIAGDVFEADIEVPRKLGWRTVWVVRDDKERAAADRSRADAVVRSIGELPALLRA